MFDPTAEWDKDRVLEIFERDLLPVIKQRGSEIGERAMQGDLLAEKLIRRYDVFAAWVDPENLRLLTNDVKAYVRARTQ